MTPTASAASVYRAAVDAGVRLSLVGYDAIEALPPGRLTPELRTAIAQQKPALLLYLQKRCSTCDNPSYLSTYWGERLCQPCSHKRAVEFDAQNTWPEWPAKECNEVS